MLGRRSFVKALGGLAASAAAGFNLSQAAGSVSLPFSRQPPEKYIRGGPRVDHGPDTPTVMPALVTDFTPQGTRVVLPSGKELHGVKQVCLEKTDLQTRFCGTGALHRVSMRIYLSEKVWLLGPNGGGVGLGWQANTGDYSCTPYVYDRDGGDLSLSVDTIETHYYPRSKIVGRCPGFGERVAVMSLVTLSGLMPVCVSAEAAARTVVFCRCAGCGRVEHRHDVSTWLTADKNSDGSLTLRVTGDAALSALRCPSCRNVRFFKEEFLADQLVRLHAEAGHVSLGFGPPKSLPYDRDVHDFYWVTACPYSHRHYHNSQA